MKMIKSIFTDKATILLRQMLNSPQRKWTINDFVKEGLSLGWVSEILNEMYRAGYVERIYKGRSSYTILKDPDRLISDWTRWYQFRFNATLSFYSPLEEVEEKLIYFFREKNKPYALTLFSGAKRIAPYVNDQRTHIYIPNLESLGNFVRFREAYNLLELKNQGNINFVIPYYKYSIFKYLQNIKGATVVSILQLYLDLYTFSPRGKEQADYLLNSIK